MMRNTYLAIAITALTVSAVSTQTTTGLLRATGEPTNHWETTPDYFTGISFWCKTRERIHINFLEVSLKPLNRSSKVEVCSDNDTRALIDTCEGKLGYCSMNLTASACRYHNQVNVTFQCVTVYDIEGMCSNQTIRSTPGEPLYLFTPYFLDAAPYNHSRQCECVVTPDAGSAVTMTNLYVDLETKTEGGCYDYLQIDSGRKNCNESMPTPMNRTFPTDTPVNIKFYSDKSIQETGAFMTFQPDQPNGMVQVSCSGNNFDPSTAPNPHSVLFVAVGDLGPTNFTQCLDAKCIQKVDLVCDPDKVIHISKLNLSHSSDSCTISPDCNWISEQPIKSCEGKTGRCSFEVCSQTPSYCRHINKIDITFQCIPSESIHPMCPNTTTTITHDKPAYYITPRFTEEGETYPAQTNCQCSVRSLDSDKVTTELLFADLYQWYDDRCKDFVGFDENDKIAKEYCNQTIINGLVSKEFTSNAVNGFQFESSFEYNPRRGAWFGIYPGSGSAVVTCNNYIGTTTEPYTKPTTTPYDFEYPVYSPYTGTIIGCTISGVILLLTVIAFIVLYLHYRKRRLRAAANFAAYPNQQMLVLQVGNEGVTDNTGQAITASPVEKQAAPLVPQGVGVGYTAPPNDEKS